MLHVDWSPGRRQLAQFGVALSGFLLLFAGWTWRGGALLGFRLDPVHAGWVAGGLAVVAGGSLLLAVAAPTWLRGPYVGLVALTYPIGMVMSYVLLGAMFFGVMTPLGLVFRLLGRDFLALRFEPAARTYWVVRLQTSDVPRYLRQY
jgi:hypothetical protein